MTTATVSYSVSSAPSQSYPSKSAQVPSVFNIEYADLNGVIQTLIGYNAPNNSWVSNFTGTVGNLYHLKAIDIQNPNAVVTVTVVENSTTYTANNSANTALSAGVTGTL
jgi:hypothetical protein